jgi:hypothetical protein
MKNLWNKEVVGKIIGRERLVYLFYAGAGNYDYQKTIRIHIIRKRKLQ